MKRFCYRCGALERDAGPLIRGLCQRCFSEETKLMEAPKKIEIVMCKNCSAYFSSGRWNTVSPDSSIAEVVEEIVANSVKVNRILATGAERIAASQAGDVKIETRLDLKKGVAEVLGKGKVHELQVKPKSESLTIPLEVNHRTCNVCSLIHGGYHEAILQIRSDMRGRELSKLKVKLEDLAAEEMKKEAKGFITNIEFVRGGFDIYLGSLALGRKLAAHLKRLGASIGESSKLIGQTKEGKRKYRVTILARFPAREG